MMQRQLRRKPLAYMHDCAEGRSGKEMTAEELHDFAVEVLMAEYKQAHSIVEKYKKNADHEADFSFINTGIRPSFEYDGVGQTKVNVMVVYDDNLECDISQIDTSWMVEEYNRTGAIPRVTFACTRNAIPEKDVEDKYICGGSYHFWFYSVSLLPDEKNEPMKERLTNIQLAAKYAETWNMMDETIIESYLDKDFHYASNWVFDELPCRAEYMQYFKGKLSSLKRAKDDIKASVIRNHQTGEVAVMIINGGTVSDMLLSFKDGRIASARMDVHDYFFNEIDPRDELYQNHGDHLDSIMPVQTLMKNHIHTIISDSKGWIKTESTVTTDDMYEENTGVFSLMYGDTDFRLLTLVCKSIHRDTNEFLSLYPYAKGKPLEVNIHKVIEWDNQVEATVFCSVGEFDFAFFATDYYCNKNKYVVGEKLSVDLSAVGIKVEEAQREFSLEGQKAAEWRAKMGMEPEFDSDGNIEPVRFFLGNMIAVLDHDSKCPDEVEFHSPVKDIEQASVLGVDFYKTDIIITRLESENDQLEICIPLYFRKDLFPTVKKGDPVRGWLWVSGAITGEHESNM